tara:strand:+ start:746 stop:1165 length:420 start_codon:yes stop_codon:yes gene_type:complete
MAQPNIVNVASIYAQSVGFNLTATATTTLFTVGDDRVLKINNIVCANVDGTNAATVDLFVTKNEFDTEDDAIVGPFTTNITVAGSFYIAKTISVPADASLVILDAPIYLMEGDILKGGASAASDLDLIVSYELINDASS